ncbi:MAG: putative Ig domain-containing protein [Bryobacterales bacterium]|nr:putative Ig domain-containing protein [Bryobacterales bacterium]
MSLGAGSVETPCTSPSASAKFTVNPAPSVTTPGVLPPASVGSPYSVSLAASGGTGTLVWSLASGSSLPPGLNFSQSSGTISGTPTQSGSFSFTVVATDSLSVSGSRAMTLQVGSPLSIPTPSTLPPGQVGAAYSTTITAAGGAPPYSYWMNVQQIRDLGLSFNTSTGVLSGIPVKPGEYRLDAAAIDSNTSIDKQFTLVIAELSPLFILTETLPEATIGETYPLSLAVSGTSPYIFSVTSGTLPQGLNLDEKSGAFTGSPTQTGVFSFTVQVTDSKSQSATKSFTLRVADALAILSSTLPSGTINQPYPQTNIDVAGGTKPYVFSLSGNLPPGISLDVARGILSGTPTTTGTYSFTATVRDAAQRQASRSFTIEVKSATVTGATVVLDTGTPAPGSQQGVAVSLNPPRNDEVTGTLFLEFTPSVTPPVDDPAIVFLNGQRQRSFRIPAGQGSALFDDATKALFQTGTVAGSIVIHAQLQAGGADATPTPPPTSTIVLPPVAPTLTSLTVTRTGSGLNLVARGYSTPRNMTSAALNFTAKPGSNITTGLSFTVNLSPAFTTWYGSQTSAAFGSQFQLTLPISITGDASEITGVSVVLNNSIGASNSMSATF